MPKVSFCCSTRRKIHDISWNIAVKLKGKRGQPGTETRDLSHSKTLSVSHTTRPLSCKQCRKFLFVARQLEKIDDVSWNIALKLEGERWQLGIETRDVSHPKCEWYHRTTVPQTMPKVFFCCSTTRKDSWRLLKHSVKFKRGKVTAGNWNPGPLAP